jgi:hypothetical protein
MIKPKSIFRAILIASLSLGFVAPGFTYFEDLCVSKDHKIQPCIQPPEGCKLKPSANSVCLAQVAQAARNLIQHLPGRSMIHADATYFLAQALGFRSDAAYWIAAYDEVPDLTRYAPIDQCGRQASESNSGKRFITAQFNGFQRTNTKLDGPLYHYVLPFSPNASGTDAHGAGGVQAVYPLHFPEPGYPTTIDDVYEGTLFNLRHWAMSPESTPGLLCAAGFTEENGNSYFNGTQCMANVPITGTVPLLDFATFGTRIVAHTGPKILDNSHGEVTYDKLEAWLKDPSRTTGTLWKDPTSTSVPIQLVRIGLYLHTLQDTASHATYCGDDAPSPPGGKDPGSYMNLEKDGVKLHFGSSCASTPHLAGHIQETGTGDAPLPLRDYTTLNLTLEELIVFGNRVAKVNGWLSNPELLPPDVVGGRNKLGQTAKDLETLLVGKIVSGQEWTRGEVYTSGLVTGPLQMTEPKDRLTSMNAAVISYSENLAKQLRGAKIVPLELMPGNSPDPNDTKACFK